MLKPMHSLFLVCSFGLGACGGIAASSSSNDAPDSGAIPQLGCSFGRADVTGTEPIVVFPTASGLTEILADRSVRALFTFGAGLGLPDTSIFIDQYPARDGFVAAHALLVDPAHGVQHEVVLLDSSGAIVWHVVYPNSTDPTLHLGANGALAVDTNEGTLPKMGSWVVGVDRVARNIQGFSPVAAPAANGETPTRRGPLAGVTPDAYGWVDPTSGKVRPLSHVLDQEDAIEGLAPLWVGDHLVYRTRDGGVLSLVSESVAGAILVPLPGTADAKGPWIAGASSTSWVLLAVNGSDAEYRANVRTGTVDAVGTSTPPGMQSANGRLDAQILDDGALLATFQSQGASQVFRSEDVGVTWIARGDPVPIAVPPHTVRSTAAESRGATTLVLTSDFVGTYQLVTGPSQVVRPANQFQAEILPASVVDSSVTMAPTPSLSPDGLCVAYWDATVAGGTLRALDVLTGQRLDLFATSHWGAAPGWLR